MSGFYTMIASSDPIMSKFDPQLGDLPLPPALRSIITGLSAASGASPEVPTIACLSILSGLAGRRALPAVNLAVISPSSASWSALHRLLMAPIMDAAAMIHDRARAANLDRLNEWLAFKQKVTESDRPDDPTDMMRGRQFRSLTGGHHHQVAVSSRPFFYLADPARKELEKGIAGSFDRSIFLDLSESGLIDRLAQSPDKPDRETADLLLRLLTNAHVAIPDAKGSRNPLGIDQPAVSALLSLSPQTHALVLRSRDPLLHRLLDRFLMVPAGPVDPEWLAQPHPIAAGLADWRHAVIDLFHARRRGNVPWLNHVPCEPLEALGAYRRDVILLEASLPREVRSGLHRMLDLPIPFLGALERLCPRLPAYQSDQVHTSNLAAAEGIARLAVGLHARHLLAAFEEKVGGDVTEFCGPEETMLRKIRQKGPLHFRDLVRSYSRQRKQDHEPALRQLLDSGQVRLTDDGKLAAADRREETA